MAQEIELKFIVEKDSVDALRQHLHTLSGEHHEPVPLLNIYYETPDNWLRSHDMGLRIRGANGRYEMTMKIAGRVVGGLHQRPEYNIDISKPELELDRFPAEVWPEGERPATLAEQVQPLFSTGFCREKWLVTEGKSRIEIALDLGEVKAGEFQEPICELELELLEGDASDVLKLARKLVSQPGLRQGSLSKAARGYHLAAGNAPRLLRETPILRVVPKASIEQGMEAALELAQIDLQNTRIIAPTDGQLGQISVRLGAYVTAGTHLTSLVPPQHWLIANLKETQLAQVRVGQRVTFTVDALNSEKFTGTVQSISPATGVEFSAISPDNATGNFVKIAQRIPVRIAVDEGQKNGQRLRPGMSVQVTIDTRAEKQQ